MASIVILVAHDGSTPARQAAAVRDRQGGRRQDDGGRRARPGGRRGGPPDHRLRGRRAGPRVARVPARGRVAETEVQLAENLWAITIDPRRALEEWLAQAGRRVGLRVLARSSAFQYFVAAAPGAKELITIAKVWELAQATRWDRHNRTYDLVVVDAPASGHGLAMLTTPRTFGEIARVGPIRRQAFKVRDLLADPERTGYVAVALPEEMPVNETLELERRLPEAVGARARGDRRQRHVAGAVQRRATRRRCGRPPRRPRPRPAGRADLVRARPRPAQPPAAAAARDVARSVTLPYLFESEIGLPEYERLGRRPGAQAVTPSLRARSPAGPLGVARRAAALLGRRAVVGWSSRRSSTVRSRCSCGSSRSSACWPACRSCPRCAGGAGAGTCAPEAIDIRHGTFTIRRTLVPMLRVQHVDTTRGLVEQTFDLATVVIHTAAGSHRDPAAAASPTPTRCATAIADLAGPPMSPEPPRRLHRAAIARLRAQRAARGGVPLLVLVVLSGSAAGSTSARCCAASPRRRPAWWPRPCSATCAGDDDVVGDAEAIHRRAGSSDKETDIPLPRIQALDLEQGPVQRCSACTRCTCRPAAAGPRARSCWRRSGPDDVRELRALLARAPAPAPRRRGPERRLARVAAAVAALTAGQLGVILPALAGFAQLAPERVRRGRRRCGWSPTPSRRRCSAAAALLVAAWLLSVRARWWRSRASRSTREGDRLRIRRGLLARREATVPVERVRAVEVVEGVLRRRSGSPPCGWRSSGTRRSRPRRRRCSRCCAATRCARSWTGCCPSWPTTSTASSRRRRGRPPLRAAAGRDRGCRRRRRVGVHAGRAVGAAAGAAARRLRAAALPGRRVAAARRAARGPLAAGRAHDRARARREPRVARARPERAAAAGAARRLSWRSASGPRARVRHLEPVLDAPGSALRAALVNCAVVAGRAPACRGASAGRGRTLR